MLTIRGRAVAIKDRKLSLVVGEVRRIIESPGFGELARKQESIYELRKLERRLQEAGR